MKPNIRCATMPNGDIEAAYMRGHQIIRLTIDPRFGNVKETTVEPYTDEFRWLVTEARKHVRP